MGRNKEASGGRLHSSSRVDVSGAAGRGFNFYCLTEKRRVFMYISSVWKEKEKEKEWADISRVGVILIPNT